MCMICDTVRRARQRQEAEQEKLRRQNELQQQGCAAELRLAGLTMPPGKRFETASAAAT